jgi:CRP/FNR family cyclic AMP-dependent transcriptional regulator
MADTPDGETFTSTLSPEELKELRALGRRRRFPRGTTLFNEGETSDRVVLVEEGRVKISYFTEEGKEVLLALRGPGDLLGEFSAFDEQPRSATGTAMDDVESVVFGREEFTSWLESHGRIALQLLRLLSAKLRDADRKRVEFAAYDTVGRVARRLVELMERFGEETDGGVRLAIPLSQEELAGWTGSSREAVAKALQTLRNRGWIDTHRRGITVLDPTALVKRAT